MGTYNITVAYETLGDFGAKVRYLHYTVSAEECLYGIEAYVKSVGERGFFDDRMYIPSARIVYVVYYPVEEAD